MPQSWLYSNLFHHPFQTRQTFCILEILQVSLLKINQVFETIFECEIFIVEKSLQLVKYLIKLINRAISSTYYLQITFFVPLPKLIGLKSFKIMMMKIIINKFSKHWIFFRWNILLIKLVLVLKVLYSSEVFKHLNFKAKNFQRAN